MKIRFLGNTSLGLRHNFIYDATKLGDCFIFLDDDGDERTIREHNFEIVEEPQMTQFKDMKIRINSPEHSNKVQAYLFSLGYTWFNRNRKEVERTSLKHLITYSDGDISCLTHDIANGFDAHSHPEFTLEETVTYSLKEIPKPIIETIEIGGMFYAKSDVKNALKGLKAIS